MRFERLLSSHFFSVTAAVGLMLLGSTAAQAQIRGLSGRLQIGTGASELEMSFTVPEGAPETVLIRAAGPTLANFGVSGTIANPAIQLFQNSTLVTSNDNWGDTNPADLQNAFSQVGAFSFAAGSNDSALLATLAPGNYSVRIYGIGGTTGIGLSELYALNGGSFGAVGVQAPLGSSFTAGLLVGPQATETLVRARGSSLGADGLDDPTLSVYSSAAQLLGANNDWGSDVNASVIAAYSNQLNLPPLATTDSGLLVDLSAGASTLRVDGSGSATAGLVRLEIVDTATIATVPDSGSTAVMLGLAGVVGWVTRLRKRVRRERAVCA